MSVQIKAAGPRPGSLAATPGCSASIGSHAIALWAKTRAPVASVAALRETSVLFAAVLGTVLLKEKFGLQRAVGTAVVVLGDGAAAGVRGR